MVSPIWSLLAVFKLWPLEVNILKGIDLRSNTCLRYVDGIFITRELGRQALIDYETKINKVDSNTKFTHELEDNATLTFLDVLLMKDNNTLKRKIYRKPVKIDSVITL